MTQQEKLLQKFMENPANIRYDELAKILESKWFFMIEAKGSHKKWKHEYLDEDLIIPVHNNDCKDVYKKKARKVFLSIH